MYLKMDPILVLLAMFSKYLAKYLVFGQIFDFTANIWKFGQISAFKY
jgi:hypothetical protein